MIQTSANKKEEIDKQIAKTVFAKILASDVETIRTGDYLTAKQTYYANY